MKTEVEKPSGLCHEKDSHTIFDNLKWLNSKDTVEYLRITAGALRNIVYRGQIVPYRRGRRLYFKRSELDKLLEGSRKYRRFKWQ